MTTKKYFYILAISTSAFLVQSCNKSEKVDNTDKIEDVSSLEEPVTNDNITSVSDETSTVDEVSSTDTKNIDKMLDDYEEYVDKYLAYLKKAQAGDMKALEEYPAMMEKAEDLEKSMEASKNDNEWNAEQMKRMMDIQSKMLSAAADMYKK